MCTDIDPRLFYAATYGGHKLVNEPPPTRRIQMGTILIVLLVLFLLGGGGWGYSRWRRN